MANQGVWEQPTLTLLRVTSLHASFSCRCPCTPPGDIIVRVNAAGGSYIRLVLLDVRTTCLSLSFLHLLRMLLSGFQC